jgi:hypothetical protein
MEQQNLNQLIEVNKSLRKLLIILREQISSLERLLTIAQHSQQLIPSSITIHPSELIALPRTMPSTQSFFYMPLITHAYYIFKKMEPTHVLLRNIYSIQQLPLLTKQRYEIMLRRIIKLMTDHPQVIIDLENEYSKDRRPDETSVGHVSGDLQEIILQSCIIDHDSYMTHFRGFPTFELDPIALNIQYFLDLIVQHYYYPDVIRHIFTDI